MKKIVALLFSVVLISCAQAKKTQDVVNKTKLAYGNYLLKLPTDLLPNAVLIAGNSSEDNYLEGVGVKFSDKQSLWGGVFFEEPTVEQIADCSDGKISRDLKLTFEKIKQELNSHKFQRQYLELIKQSSCQFAGNTPSVSTDITSRYIIVSQCENLQCDTYVVEKNNTNNSQILMLFTKGFKWSWVKEVIKGA